MSKIQGIKELSEALTELKDFKRSDGKSALRAAVAVPGRKIATQTKANIGRISPGKALLHRTYRGRLVGAGFASRNVRMVVRINKALTSATALIGMAAEAFYAVAFFERGTSKIPRQPFLVPALEAKKDTAVVDVGKAFEKRIIAIANKYAKRAPKPERS